MKKYVKPDLYYENLELSEHIATCAWDMSDSTDAINCTAVSDYEYVGESDWVIFTGRNSNCQDHIEEKEYEKYCYTNGELTFSIFNS